MKWPDWRGADSSKGTNEKKATYNWGDNDRRKNMRNKIARLVGAFFITLAVLLLMLFIVLTVT